jgi:hypothetical protein
MYHALQVLYHISVLYFGKSCTTCCRSSGRDKADQRYGLLVRLILILIFLYVGIYKVCYLAVSYLAAEYSDFQDL